MEFTMDERSILTSKTANTSILYVLVSRIDTVLGCWFVVCFGAEEVFAGPRPSLDVWLGLIARCQALIELPGLICLLPTEEMTLFHGQSCKLQFHPYPWVC
jgi:hypothetical protein